MLTSPAFGQCNNAIWSASQPCLHRLKPGKQNMSAAEMLFWHLFSLSFWHLFWRPIWHSIMCSGPWVAIGLGSMAQTAVELAMSLNAWVGTCSGIPVGWCPQWKKEPLLKSWGFHLAGGERVTHLETNFEIGSLPSAMRIETHKWARQIGAWIHGRIDKRVLI